MAGTVRVDKSADDLAKDPQIPDEDLPTFLQKPRKSNDPETLKKQAIDDKGKAIKQESDLRAVLSTESGIRFIGRILGEYCYIDTSAFHPNNSTMCNISGRRQVGQQIKEAIREVDFDLWVKVDRELEALRPKAKKER